MMGMLCLVVGRSGSAFITSTSMIRGKDVKSRRAWRRSPRFQKVYISVSSQFAQTKRLARHLSIRCVARHWHLMLRLGVVNGLMGGGSRHSFGWCPWTQCRVPDRSVGGRQAVRARREGHLRKSTFSSPYTASAALQRCHTEYMHGQWRGS
jgi:hypothetical protein